MIAKGCDVKIMPATVTDCGDIAALNADVFIRTYKGITTDLTEAALRYHVSDDWRANKTRHYEGLLRNGVTLTIAKVGQKAVGFAMVGEEFGLYISPDYQRSAVTLRLIESMASSIIDDRTVEKLKFTTVVGSSAVRFYERIGCIPTGRDVATESPILRGGQILPQIEMELSIDAVLRTKERINTVLSRRDALSLQDR